VTFPPRVYLTGFMGSGKSTVGPLLADRLGYRFVDLDWLIEARTGRSIPDLFVESGEAAFRVAEAGALLETTRGMESVVSTGGGTFVVPANRIAAQNAGAVVWLRATPDLLLPRLGSGAGRPLLAGPDGLPLAGAALAERVEHLVRARDPHYAQADLAVDAGGAPEAVAREIAERLRSWRRGPALPG
jgi:shikimate kinase